MNMHFTSSPRLEGCFSRAGATLRHRIFRQLIQATADATLRVGERGGVVLAVLQEATVSKYIDVAR